MFVHFVITRFNVSHKSAIYQQDRNGLPTNTDEWLHNRFMLFEKFCLPGMQRQVNKNFHWIVAFHEDTPSAYKERIDGYRRQCENFKPVFVKQGEDHMEWVKSYMDNFITPDVQYIITSRIDNDDAFHERMIAAVQAEFDCQQDIFLSFNYGLQYDLQRQLLSKAYYECNAFISRIEEIKQGAYATVLAVVHHKAPRTAAVKYINTIPLWLQLIHARNLYNKFNAKHEVQYSNKLLQGFHLEGRVGISMSKTFAMVWQKTLRRLKIVKDKDAA